MRAKICGIRSAKDLRIALEAGADAVGFISGVTHVSEDALDADVARNLARSVPPYVSRVLVTHRTEAADILGLSEAVGTDHIQVHGLVTADTLESVFRGAAGRRVIAVVHVTGADALQKALEASSMCHAVHLDSRTGDRLGGTGQTHDWSVSAEIVGKLAERHVPVILSGGLTPANVQSAGRAVRPYAVDVNSGIEDAAGDKSPALADQFVALAHAAG